MFQYVSTTAYAIYSAVEANVELLRTKRCARPCDDERGCSGDQECCDSGACGTICQPKGGKNWGGGDISAKGHDTNSNWS